MNFGDLRSHFAQAVRNFSTGRFTGIFYSLEFTANEQEEMLGRPGWGLFLDEEDNDCNRESLQSSPEAELTPEL